IEGDASVTAMLVMAKRSGRPAEPALQLGAFFLQSRGLEALEASPTGLPQLSSVARDVLSFLYGDGARLALGLYRAGGTAALDRALAAPPPTSMAVLHPNTWLDGWNWLPAPQASASLASGSLGALFVRLMLNGCGGEAQTERLVSAFRADAYV